MLMYVLEVHVCQLFILCVQVRFWHLKHSFLTDRLLRFPELYSLKHGKLQLLATFSAKKGRVTEHLLWGVWRWVLV